MYTKNQLSLSVAIACGALSVGVVQTTQADSVFFPQVVGSQSVTTILSVINKGVDSTNDNQDRDSYWSAGSSTLHYTLYYKNSNDQANCLEYNEYLPTSQFDIASIDIAGNLTDEGVGGVLFNDPSMNPGRFGNGYDYALGRDVLPMRGYLIVDNQASDSMSEPTLTGEAFLFDFGSGAAWSYEAFWSTGDDVGADDTDRYSEFDYSWARMSPVAPINLMPLDEFNTGFLVTPVNIPTETAAPYGWVAENMRPASQNTFKAKLKFSTTDQFGADAAIYDRDEKPVSGALEAPVVCVARVPASALMSGAAYARLIDGGWGNLATARTEIKSATNVNGLAPTQPKLGDGTTGAVVYKVEYNNVGATFGGITIPGTFNTGTLMLPYYAD